MKPTAIYYTLLILSCALGIVAVLHLGQRLPAPGAQMPRPPEQRHDRSAEASSARAAANQSGALQSSPEPTLHNPVGQLLLQLLVILAASRLIGRLFSAIGQPPVVGEMAAGILLGPSLFGLTWPAGFHFVFPDESFGTLRLLSQLGVCLFMFAVGMELEVGHVRNRARTAVVVSNASIIVP